MTRRTSSVTSPRRSPRPTRMRPTTTSTMARPRPARTATPRPAATPASRAARAPRAMPARVRDPGAPSGGPPAPPAAPAAPTTPARMRLAGAELLDSREILPGQWLQTYRAPEIIAGAWAGQFVHVRAGDDSGLVLRRPFSINTMDLAAGTLTIHFRVIGRGTAWFTYLRPGDRIEMLGPLGRPFEVDPRSRHILLIDGGLGMAGVRSLADEAIRD